MNNSFISFWVIVSEWEGQNELSILEPQLLDMEGACRGPLASVSQSLVRL